MKFMAGMLIGAALLLTLAGIAPGTELVTQARNQGVTIWTHLLGGVADALFAPPQGGDAPAPGNQAVVQAFPSPAKALPATVDEDVATQPESLTLPADLPVAVPPAAPSADPGNAPEPMPLPLDIQAADRAQAPVAFVWQAFHSEISARGFARHLQEIVAYPLEVRKQGPARYRVAFTYESIEQRDALLQQIAQVMGTSR